MSLLTPERVPVKVYKWDDVGAPVLDKSSGCMMDIFKSCLVTGYGTKEGAGWAMPFEDTGIKVLRPEVGSHTDFYLRLSSDSGTEIAAQVYLNMADANTGDLKLQCRTNFKYAKGQTTNKWILVASGRAFWFFAESGGPQRGVYYFTGDIVSYDSPNRAVYLHHSGGDSNTGNVYADPLFDAAASYTGGIVDGQLLHAQQTYSVRAVSCTDARIPHTQAKSAAPLIVYAGGVMHRITGIYAATAGGVDSNFDELKITGGESVIDVIVFSAAQDPTNYYLAKNEWVQ